MEFKKLDNDTCECICIIKSVSVKTTARGGNYLDMMIGDRTGEMVAKFWDYNESLHGTYEPNQLIKIRGRISPYNGVDQFRIERIRLITENDNVDIADYVPAAEYDGNQMLDELIAIVNGFEDEELKKLVLYLLNENSDRLLYWPAAYRLHHAMRGGLLTHMLSIVRLAQQYCKIYTALDEELLLSGAILHDIAKLSEFDVPDTGLASGYTTKGTLLGHLAMGAMQIDEAAKKLDISDETATLLEHMVLSHHGIPEYGSAVMPMFPEAEVLSALDTLDAKIFEYYDNLENVQVDDFSGKVWSLDNRKLYNHGRIKGEHLPKLF